MAAKVIKYESFYRGDTPVFAFNFTPPTDDFDWSGVVADGAITSVATPTDNTGAGVYRSDEVLTVDADNVASFEMQPTVAESKAFTVGTYKVQVQLKDNAGANVATTVTGEVKVLQDYVI